MSVHLVGGRGRRFLYRYAPRTSLVGAAWDLTEKVGLMREASRRGFSLTPVCGGTACWSAPLGGYPRGAASPFAHNVEAMGERGVGWSTLGYFIQVGMRGNAAGPVCPGHIQKKTRTKVCHYAPSSEGALRRGKTSWNGGPLWTVPWKIRGKWGTRRGQSRYIEFASPAGVT